jgi:hypothetical protein
MGRPKEAWGRTYVRSKQRTNCMAAGRRPSRRGWARPNILWTEPKLDGIWGGSTSYPGKPSCAGIECYQRYPQTEPNSRTRSRAGHRRWQIHGQYWLLRADKANDRVEDKTLTSGKTRGRKNVLAWEPVARRWYDWSHPIPIRHTVKSGHSKYRPWNVGSRGREALVTTLRSRVSVAIKVKDTRKPKMEMLETDTFLGIRCPIPRTACNPAISSAEQSRRESETCKGVRTGLWSETTASSMATGQTQCRCSGYRPNERFEKLARILIVRFC